jgi:Uma2 family endonuclease
MSTAEVLTPPPPARNDPYDHDRYEIVDGIRVELPPMGTESTGVASDLAVLLANFGLTQNVGKAYTEMLVKLPLNRDRSRKPDVIFVPFTTWPRGQRLPEVSPWEVVPNLCVEVVSPSDRAGEVMEKVREYLEAGVRLVWVVYPQQAWVHVFEQPAGPARILTRADTLDGGTVLPGFAVPLADLLWEPDPAAAGPDDE